MSSQKDTYYFSHDSNAITDTKILNMRADYTLERLRLVLVHYRDDEK